jgi:hypothetical protein
MNTHVPTDGIWNYVKVRARLSSVLVLNGPDVCWTLALALCIKIM